MNKFERTANGRAMRSVKRIIDLGRSEPIVLEHDLVCAYDYKTGQAKWTAIWVALVLVLCFAIPAHSYTVDQYANAIKRQEGSRWPYGIKEFGHISSFKARIICKRTIRHKWQNYSILPLKDRQAIDFVDYLADRYCPKSVDPIGNINWKRNIPILLKKEL